jgi:ankyrin repeat protein
MDSNGHNDSAKSESLSLDDQLLLAAQENDLDRAKSLCDQGASPAFVNRKEGTWGARTAAAAIHFALQNHNIEMTRLLLEKGAKPSALWEDYDWRGGGSSQTAFDMASTLGEDFVLLFLEHGADPNLVSRSAQHSMRTDGSKSWRLLHKASEEGSLTLVDALIKARADINLLRTEKFSNERGYNRDNAENALHIACRGRHLAIAERLLEESAERGLNGFADVLCRRTLHKPSNAVSPTDDPRSEGYVSPVVCVQVRARCRVLPFLSEW